MTRSYRLENSVKGTLDEGEGREKSERSVSRAEPPAIEEKSLDAHLTPKPTVHRGGFQMHEGSPCKNVTGTLEEKRIDVYVTLGTDFPCTTLNPKILKEKGFHFYRLRKT